MKEDELSQVQEGIDMIERKLLMVYRAEADLLSFMDEEYRKWTVFLRCRSPVGGGAG